MLLGGQRTYVTWVVVVAVVLVSVVVSCTTGMNVLKYAVVGSIDRYDLHQSSLSSVKLSKHGPALGTRQLR